MSEASTIDTPAPIEGHSAYNRSSRVQAAGSSPTLPLLAQAARDVAQWAALSRASAFPMLAAKMDGGRSDARGPAFLQRMEIGMAKRLAIAPEQMRIPLAKMVLVKRAD